MPAIHTPIATRKLINGLAWKGIPRFFPIGLVDMEERAAETKGPKGMACFVCLRNWFYCQPPF